MTTYEPPCLRFVAYTEIIRSLFEVARALLPEYSEYVDDSTRDELQQNLANFINESAQISLDEINASIINNLSFSSRLSEVDTLSLRRRMFPEAERSLTEDSETSSEQGNWIVLDSNQIEEQIIYLRNLFLLGSNKEFFESEDLSEAALSRYKSLRDFGIQLSKISIILVQISEREQDALESYLSELDNQIRRLLDIVISYGNGCE